MYWIRLLVWPEIVAIRGISCYTLVHELTFALVLLVDSYRKWPRVVPLKSMRSALLIEEMFRFFCDFGRPEELESDNGTKFVSAEFREYCKKINVTKVTSSP